MIGEVKAIRVFISDNWNLIYKPEDARIAFESYGVDAVMIVGELRDQWLLNEIKQYLSTESDAGFNS